MITSKSTEEELFEAINQQIHEFADCTDGDFELMLETSMRVITYLDIMNFAKGHYYQKISHLEVLEAENDESAREQMFAHAHRIENAGKVVDLWHLVSRYWPKGREDIERMPWQAE